MLFNKLALTLLGMVVVAAALPSSSSQLEKRDTERRNDCGIVGE